MITASETVRLVPEVTVTVAPVAMVNDFTAVFAEMVGFAVATLTTAFSSDVGTVPHDQLAPVLHELSVPIQELLEIVIVIVFDVAGELLKQGVALEVITTVTASLLANVVDVKVVLSVPTLLPLTFHWYDGEAPPLVGVAVNVTLVPWQIGPEGDAAMATLAVSVGFTVIVPVAFTLPQPPDKGIL